MNYKQHREHFIAQMGEKHHTAALALLREATTLHRLDELQCSGGYPYEDGVTPAHRFKPCTKCETLTRKRALSKKGWCPSCMAEARVLKVWPNAQLQGDPRGWPIHIALDDGRKVGVPPGPNRNRW